MHWQNLGLDNPSYWLLLRKPTGKKKVDIISLRICLTLVQTAMHGTGLWKQNISWYLCYFTVASRFYQAMKRVIKGKAHVEGLDGWCIPDLPIGNRTQYHGVGLEGYAHVSEYSPRQEYNLSNPLFRCESFVSKNDISCTLLSKNRSRTPKTSQADQVFIPPGG